MPTVDTPTLRQCVLAVSVLTDLDVTPSDPGVLLPGTPDALVEWSDIAAAVGGYDPSGPIARRRVENLLRLHALARDYGSSAANRFRAAFRLVALPRDHVEHLGAGWVQEPLRGDALDLGFAVLGLLGDADRTTPVPPSVLRALQIETRDCWSGLREHSERMGALSATRLVRDGQTGVIRPVGGCDVLALLSSRTLRRHLAESDGSGLRCLAAPTRRRGWFDISQIDPAFVQTAWSLTDEPDRGTKVPLLVTVDEVTLPFSLA
jgi:hypothetical protein